MCVYMYVHSCVYVCACMCVLGIIREMEVGMAMYMSAVRARDINYKVGRAEFEGCVLLGWSPRHCYCEFWNMYIYLCVCVCVCCVCVGIGCLYPPSAGVLMDNAASSAKTSPSEGRT